MIAIIGRIASGKTTLCKNLHNRHFSTFNCDEFYEKNYLKNGLFYNAINEKIGDFLNDDFGINKEKIKSWINQNKSHLGLLEKYTYPILYEYLKNHHFDFVEIPKIISKYCDFSNLFSGIICIENSTEKEQKNWKSRGVDNFLKNKISAENNPFYMKKQLFGRKTIVNIYEYNCENDEIIDLFLSLLSLND